MSKLVMAGIVRAIHVFRAAKTEMPGCQIKPEHDVEGALRHCAPRNDLRRHFFVLPESLTASKVANSTL